MPVGQWLPCGASRRTIEGEVDEEEYDRWIVFIRVEDEKRKRIAFHLHIYIYKGEEDKWEGKESKVKGPKWW